jgi:hypothetical protein
MSDRHIVAAVLRAAIPLASSTLEHLRIAKKTQKKYPAADLKSQLRLDTVRSDILNTPLIISADPSIEDER